MLTLLVTVLFSAYFVVPLVLYRFTIGFFLVRKTMAASKSEELMLGTAWSVLPLLLAWALRQSFFYRWSPGSVPSAQTVFTSLYTDKLFESQRDIFFPALATFTRANLCLLGRTYLIVLLASVTLGFVARYFGIIRAHLESGSFASKALHLLLPLISEWHIALSPMLLRDRKQWAIEIDVMTKGGILYRGAVSEKKITSDGTLQTLILTSTERFLHTDFVRDRSAYEAIADKGAAAKPSTSTYWRKIPGELFLIMGSEISTVNVRHVSTVSSINPREDPQLQSILSELANLLNDKLAQNRRQPGAKMLSQ